VLSRSNVANWLHLWRDVADGERSCGTRPAPPSQRDFANNDLSFAPRNSVSAAMKPPAISGTKLVSHRRWTSSYRPTDKHQPEKRTKLSLLPEINDLFWFDFIRYISVSVVDEPLSLFTITSILQSVHTSPKVCEKKNSRWHFISIAKRVYLISIQHTRHTQYNNK